VARCLSTLESLPVEGYSSEAQRALSGGAGPFPHTLDYARKDLLVYRATVAERMSMSGVQDKVSLRLVDGKLAPTDVGGQYILKPRPGGEVPRLTDDVPANEHVTMLIAERVFGIDTPPHGLVRLADGSLAFLVKRFDHLAGAKIPQEDFSQILEITPETHGRNYKYDAVSYEEVGAKVLELCPEDRDEFYVRVVFCYALSNGDAHLKNFSLFQPGLDGAYRLTPAYDLVCTTLHFPNEARLALVLLKEGAFTEAFDSYGFETGADFFELGARMGMTEDRVAEILDAFVSGAAENAVADLVGRSFLSEEAKVVYTNLFRDRQKALRIGWE
jgi:serine/threonine-protein kinase HipA